MPASEGRSLKPVERLRRKVTVENLWLYVIASLTARGPMYAYKLRGTIEELFGFRPSTVTLYTVVYRLAREGLVEKLENGDYRVTPLGLEALREGLGFLRETVERLEKALGEGGSRGP